MAIVKLQFEESSDFIGFSSMLESLQVIFGVECVVIWRLNAKCWTDSSDVDTDEEGGSQMTAPYSSMEWNWNWNFKVKFPT